MSTVVFNYGFLSFQHLLYSLLSRKRGQRKYVVVVCYSYDKSAKTIVFPI